MADDGYNGLAAAHLTDGDPKAIVIHLQALERQIRQLADRVLEALAQLNKRLDGVDNRLSLIEQHAVVLERRVTELERPKRKARR